MGAEELDLKVMEASFKLRVLGREHPNTLASMANLASIYRNQGRWLETEILEVRVMKTRKRVLGQAHPDTLTSMSTIASTIPPTHHPNRRPPRASGRRLPLAQERLSRPRSGAPVRASLAASSSRRGRKCSRQH